MKTRRLFLSVYFKRIQILPTVILLKGKRQVGAITASKGSPLVTIITGMNAAGRFVPPMLVFPRKNIKQELVDGAPPGTIAGTILLDGYILSLH